MDVGRLLALLAVVDAVLAGPGGGSAEGNPMYVTPVDPMMSPTQPLMNKYSNMNPLNPAFLYNRMQAGNAGPGVAGVNPNKIPPGVVQPGNVPVAAAVGDNKVEDFPQFLQLSAQRVKPRGKNTMPSYVLPIEIDEDAAAQGHDFMDKQSKINPFNKNAQFDAPMGKPPPQASTPLTSPPLPQGVGSGFNQPPILGALLEEAEDEAVPKGKAKPVPSYLLPVDPNQPAEQTFMNKASNVNPMNVNSQYMQKLGGKAQIAGGPAGQGAAAVPIGVGAGQNPVQEFPQFLEEEDLLDLDWDGESKTIVTPEISPSWMLPVDPNAPAQQKIFRPESNLNDLNVQARASNKELEAEMKAEGHTAENMQPGTIPAGTEVGKNSPPPFPEFMELGDCQGCTYE